MLPNCRRFAAACITLIPSLALGSTLSTQGYSGLIEIPDAFVTEEGYLDFGYNNDIESGTERAALKKASSAENYQFSTGVWSHLEIGGRDSGRDFSGGSDLTGSAKLNIFQNNWLALAAGAADFGGKGRSQHQRSTYGVATVTWQTLQISGGYGAGPDRLDGAFGGARWTAMRYLDVIAEYDTRETNAGIKLHYDFPSGLSMYLSGAASTDDRQKSSFNVGLYLPLSSHKKGLSARPVPTTTSATADAEADTSNTSTKEDETEIALSAPAGVATATIDTTTPDAPPQKSITIAQKTVISTDTPKDSLLAVEAASSASDLSRVSEYRFGIPIRSFLINPSDDGRAAQQVEWRSWLRGGAPSFKEPIRAEIRLSPDLRSYVGTEVGMFDYALALKSAARLQLPLGLGGYVVYQTPLTHTDDFDPHHTFASRRYNAGLREAAVQWAFHPVNGLIGLASVGRTEIENIDYDFEHVDVALLLGGGRHRLRVAYGNYDPFDALNYKDHTTKVAEYRYWWIRKGLSASVSYGEFFFDDKGTTIQLQRYFGDTTFGIFYKKNTEGDQVGGVSIGIPLTVNHPPRLGPVVLTGDPRFNYSVGTQINPDYKNFVRPLFMVEPLPQYSLVKDVLDSDRAFPAYAEHYSSEGP